MNKQYIVFGLALLLSIATVLALSGNTAVNLAMDSVTPKQNTVVNVELGTTSPTDTCTYSGSGDMTITCSDNCTLTNVVVLGNIIANGAGTLTFNNVVATNLTIQSTCTPLFASGSNGLIPRGNH